MADVIPPPPFTSTVVEGRELTATAVWRQWLMTLTTWMNKGNGGFTGTITLAKLTSGGANGTVTVVDGIITNYVAPT